MGATWKSVFVMLGYVFVSTVVQNWLLGSRFSVVCVTLLGETAFTNKKNDMKKQNDRSQTMSIDKKNWIC